MHYVSLRGSEMGPFFQRLDGQPLTKGHFTAKVREALKAVACQRKILQDIVFELAQPLQQLVWELKTQS